MKSVVLCGVPYSDNLGDGVIADCIQAFVEKENIGKVTLCDISYRTEVEYNGTKGDKLSVFQKMPSFIRKLFVLTFFSLKYFLKGKKHIVGAFSGADIALIGGGQLLSDVDWNFPLKLYFIVKQAEKQKVPVHIIAVGVSSKWSWGGKLLMKRVLNSKVVKSVAVRDQFSKENIGNYLEQNNATILPDPAVMSSIYYPYQKVNSGKKVIAVGVADIAGLNYSSDIVNSSESNSPERIISLIEKINDSGAEALLFTNGALEDEIYLQQTLFPCIAGASKQLKYQVQSRFDSVQAMVKFLAKQDAVIAFRLHANIVASSYNVPHFAIGWDNKVKSFFKLQMRDQFTYLSLADVVDHFDAICNLVFETKLTARSVREDYINHFKKF